MASTGGNRTIRKEISVMWKRLAIVGSIIVFVLVSGGGMSMYAVQNEGQSSKQEGKMYFQQLEFPKGTILFDTPDGNLVSLRAFFEGMGSEVIYDEKTGNVTIKHLNQLLMWVRLDTPNCCAMQKIENPSKVDFGTMGNTFQLNPMGGTGWYTIIDGRIYLDLGTFEYMINGVGYRLESDLEEKTAIVSLRTLNNSALGSVGGDNDIDGKSYYFRPLSDGSFTGIHMSDDLEILSEIIVDAEGRIYELTDKVVEGSVADTTKTQNDENK